MRWCLYRFVFGKTLKCFCFFLPFFGMGVEGWSWVTASFMLDFGGCSAPWLCSRAQWQDGVLAQCPEWRCQDEPDELWHDDVAHSHVIGFILWREWHHPKPLQMISQCLYLRTMPMCIYIDSKIITWWARWMVSHILWLHLTHPSGK